MIIHKLYHIKKTTTHIKLSYRVINLQLALKHLKLL